MRLRTRRQLEIGRLDDAIDSALQQVRFAELITTSPSGTTEVITTVYLGWAAMADLRQVAAADTVTSRQLRRALSALPDDMDRRMVMARVLRLEYLRLKDMVRELQTMAEQEPGLGGMRWRWFGAPQHIINIVMANTRLAIARMDEEHWPGPLGGFEAVEGLRRTLAGDNHRIYSDPSTLVFIAACPYRARALFELQRIALALRIHELERGQLPATLDGLVPDILPSLPVDPFGGQGFRYAPERRIVYSVGSDGTDDRGTSDEGRDIVVQL